MSRNSAEKTSVATKTGHVNQRCSPIVSKIKFFLITIQTPSERKTFINRVHSALVVMGTMLVVIIYGCTSDGNFGKSGEELNAELALNESYDQVRNGARLILAYDAQSNSFKGTVENTTGKTLKQV